MAGVTGSGGTPVSTTSVPSIGGNAEVVSSAHLNESRAEGVAYDTNVSVGEKLDTGGFPTGTDFGESSNVLRP